MAKSTEIIPQAAQLFACHIPRWQELPDLALYMDQVIGQLDKYLAGLTRVDAEHFVTASMINNYVKLGLLPAPVKKRYGRAQLAHLVVICLLKQVLSIPEIKLLVDAHLAQSDNLEAAYDAFCAAQEQAYTLATTQTTAPAARGLSPAALAMELAVQAGAAKATAQSLLLEKSVGVVAPLHSPKASV